MAEIAFCVIYTQNISNENTDPFKKSHVPAALECLIHYNAAHLKEVKMTLLELLMLAYCNWPV